MGYNRPMGDEETQTAQESDKADPTAFQRSLAALAQVPKAEIDALEAARKMRSRRVAETKETGVLDL